MLILERTSPLHLSVPIKDNETFNFNGVSAGSNIGAAAARKSEIKVEEKHSRGSATIYRYRSVQNSSVCPTEQGQKSPDYYWKI